MSGFTRRDSLRLLATAGALALPGVTGLLKAAGRQAAGGSGPRERLLADEGWRFHLGHADDPARDFGFGRGSGIFSKSGSLLGGGRAGLASPGFDDSAWSPVDLPHDWAVDLPFVSDRAVNGHGAKPLGRAYPETSIGWYRRAFDIPSSDLGRRISLAFDGVFRDSIVILNNHYVGRHLSGYSPFEYDVTDLVTYGGRNTLILRVDATEGEGWFYEGAGIYRHVWLDKTAAVHVASDGVFARASVARSGEATITVDVDVVNDSDRAVDCDVVCAYADANGPGRAGSAPVRAALPAWERRTVRATFAIPRAALWSVEAPHLYRLHTRVRTSGTETDHVETNIGVCTRQFDPDRGFFLNGARVEIKGTCNHQDHAGVGAGLPDALQAFRVTKLKEMGSNAYRTSHNPPTPELLDACDRLGMFVLDETRMMASTDEGLDQLRTLVRRDRNHPSVFCWSIGNEEPDQATDRGARVAATMKHVVHELDPTRLCTEAMNNNWGRGLSDVVDVQGFNYHVPAGEKSGDEIDAYHRSHPHQPTMGTEVASTVSTRGIYENDPAKGYVSAYDRNFPPWASTAETWWTTYAARPFVAGGFVWTGFDYRGEPTPYDWPCINSHFGIIDMCGFPKDIFYYYQAWWSGQDVLHLFPHWNWAGREGREIEVWCFTNLDRVELFVNGASAGARTVERNSHVSWKVPYAPGAIEARGVKKDGSPLVARRETAGPAAAIVLAPDRARVDADGEDVACVAARIVDAQGRDVPTADHEITFAVTGPGRLIGLGNGDPSSHEADRVKPGSSEAWKRHAFNGLCMALLQARKEPGAIRLEASAAGLTAGRAELTSVTAPIRPALA